MRCSFCVRLTAPLNLCPIYLKLLVHVHLLYCTCTSSLRQSRQILKGELSVIHKSCTSTILKRFDSSPAPTAWLLKPEHRIILDLLKSRQKFNLFLQVLKVLAYLLEFAVTLLSISSLTWKKPSLLKKKYFLKCAKYIVVIPWAWRGGIAEYPPNPEGLRQYPPTSGGLPTEEVGIAQPRRMRRVFSNTSEPCSRC